MIRKVYIVEDQAEVRESVRALLSIRENLIIIPYSSGDAFIEAVPDRRPGVILLDLRMPGMTGIDVINTLRANAVDWPVIVLTGHGTIATAIEAMKLGAVDFLEKPYRPEALLDAVDAAFARLDRSRQDAERIRDAQERIALLTEREAQVLEAIVNGDSNKVIAFNLGLSVRTVELHRAKLMSKLSVRSIADAVKLTFTAAHGGPVDA